jgi:thymidylate synthase (FAD)
MSLPEHLQKFMDEPIPVLDDGHVQLVDVMGDDMTIVNAARVSYGAGTKRVSADRHLIRYLMRHRHTTPFEMCSITFRVRVPMDAWRQWIRHRTASVNEYSTRYSEAIDSAQKTAPDQWRSQATNNKQGSGGFLTGWPEELLGTDEDGEQIVQMDDYEISTDMDVGEFLSEREAELQAYARGIYEERIKLGVAREQARKDLPLSTYTEAYWKMDLHNLFHFLALRMDSHAQKEIREFANAVATIVKEWVPWAWEAFEDYRLGGMYLTRFEVEGLKEVMSQYGKLLHERGIHGHYDVALGHAVAGSGLPVPEEGKKESREVTELKQKFLVLLGG